MYEKFGRIKVKIPKCDVNANADGGKWIWKFWKSGLKYVG